MHFKELIIFENDNYIVINKPYGIPTLDDRDLTVTAIIRMAKAYNSDSQVCHRLDKETSGCLAIAKNPEAYRSLSMQFEHRDVEKTYHAVVCGAADLDNIAVNLPILPLPNGIVKIDKLQGKEAVTHFNTLQVYKKNSLVECKPLTGRMHQIRAHLAWLKHPIVADKQYGGEDVFLSTLKKKFNLKKSTEELPLIRRVALHAYKLNFADIDAKPLDICAEYPKDMGVLIRLLAKYT